MAKKKDKMTLIIIVLVFVLLIAGLSYTGVINVGTSSVTGLSQQNCKTTAFLSQSGYHYQSFDQLRSMEKLNFTDTLLLQSGFNIMSDGVYLCH